MYNVYYKQITSAGTRHSLISADNCDAVLSAPAQPVFGPIAGNKFMTTLHEF